MADKNSKMPGFMKAMFAKKAGKGGKKGKPFADGGSYPVRLNLDEIKKRTTKGENRPAKPSTQSDLDRHARRQGEESRSEAMVMKRAKGGMMADKMGRAMKKKSADTMGRAMKKYAKGGSIDGIAKKGKTRTKYPSMKNGGMC